MEYNSHPNAWVGAQYQSTVASGQHQLYPGSQHVWVDPLTCPILTQTSSSAGPVANSQQQDQQARDGLGTLDLAATQNITSEWTSHSAQRVEDLLRLTSQSLLPLTLQHLADEFAEYKRKICIVFQSIINGHLDEAGRRLLEASAWLLGHIEDLGEFKFSARVTYAYRLFGKALHIDDDASYYECRKQLWGDFNAAWLAIFQKQMDTLKDSGQGMRHPYNLMNREYISIMATELMSVCDGIVKYGLIDYEYGVWEDWIIQGN